uniref:tRNA (guanine(46)-N(7))-methyltransferase n=2 Tax=Corethron hystrix TaxID=216773 RepID=A0A7S1BKL0_9STRA|mmetsp:Transcript_29868/g.68525  ORF Transcript_29868/g.68525 Transcript_29868/m.68525 type:complete len:273 (+) Transcript_29868:251-1069(+)
MYTLSDTSHPPPDPSLLRSTVQRHLSHLPTYLNSRPVAAHTAEAYTRLVDRLNSISPHWKEGGVVLDSGCGTGRSSHILGKMYPDKIVVGVDRSENRLQRSKQYRDGQNVDNEFGEEAWIGGSDHFNFPPRPPSSNVFLVRADLADLYRLASADDVRLHAHYMLYPNPYPKPRRYKHRWHCHPSFPLLLSLGGTKIVVRSNWKGYLQQFSTCVEFAAEEWKGEGNRASPYLHSAKGGPRRILTDDKFEAMTNFEKKFVDSGEPIYELELKWN